MKSFTYSLLFSIVVLFSGQMILAQNTPAEKQIAPSEAQAQSTDTQTETTELETTKPAPEAVAKTPSPGLVDLFVVGGWTMWPLLLSSIVALGIAFERMYFFYTTKLFPKGYTQFMSDHIGSKGLEGAVEYLNATKEDRASNVILNGLDVASGDPEIFSKGVEREASEVIIELEKGLTILSAVSTIAPLIGFLGTVSGMINAFDAIANADQVNAKVVAGGIKEALITTAAGLIVAIPAMSLYQFLTSKVNMFAAEVEEAANGIYKELLRRKGKISG